MNEKEIYKDVDLANGVEFVPPIDALINHEEVEIEENKESEE